MPTKRSTRIQWETKDNRDIPLSKLAEHYFTTCASEGKTPSTVRGYRDKLGRYVRWVEDATLSDFLSGAGVTVHLLPQIRSKVRRPPLPQPQRRPPVGHQRAETRAGTSSLLILAAPQRLYRRKRAGQAQRSQRHQGRSWKHTLTPKSSGRSPVWNGTLWPVVVTPPC